jgi:hypothetical protein
MKKLIKTILFLSLISCSAQTPILNIAEDNGNQINGAYYKDINNLLDPFTGTYIYTNGNESFKIVLQKKTMSSVNNIYFEDLIIGEYQYIKDGIEIVNSLPKLNQVFINQSLHNISGNLILIGNELCEECSANEMHLHGTIKDENTNNYASLRIRKISINGEQAIKIYYYWNYNSHVEGTPLSPQPSFPGGEFVLIQE